MNRYIAEPNNSAQPHLGIYKWRVFDTGDQKAIAYTVERKSAEDYASQMNEKGYIEVEEDIFS